jgi:agmatinase
MPLPVTPPFLGSRQLERPRLVLLGVPLDRTQYYRSGTGLAPGRIRLVSDILETYSPELHRDLSEVAFTDAGDIEVGGLGPEAAVEQIARETVPFIQAGSIPILVGGEHTLTLGGVRAAHSRHPDLVVLQLDAHLDLAAEDRGMALTHWTVFRRIADEIGQDRLIQLGIRSGTREEFLAAGRSRYWSADVRLPTALRRELGRVPIYLSIDIDVLDPAVAPGTGSPEPPGVGFRELIDFIYSLRNFRIVAADLVEVSPPYDRGDLTAVVAAKLLRELILLLG